MRETSSSTHQISEFPLKLFAMATMTIDHIGFFLEAYPSGSPAATTAYVFRIIGRLALPLYMFFLAEGMRHTRHPWRYLLRLFGLFAIIALGETIFLYGFGGKAGGVIYSADSLNMQAFTDLFFCGAFLCCLRLKGPKKLFALLPFAYIALSFGCAIYDNFYPSNTILWFPRYLRCGYNLLALAICLGFYFAPNLAALAYAKPLKELKATKEDFYETALGRKAINEISAALLLAITMVFWGISYTTSGRQISPVSDMSIQTYCILAGIPLLFYSGKRGYDSKTWRIFSYLYYPVHLAILLLIFSLN